ncbi:MAG: virulence RhuM family protein [Muribaculaceae bacterium]|nr:virulence RhuM family protein [Muribaculaceae bacterium]
MVEYSAPKTEELTDLPTVAKFAIVQKEGERTVTRNVKHYNLDVIISVGYRVDGNFSIADSGQSTNHRLVRWNYTCLSSASAGLF